MQLEFIRGPFKMHPILLLLVLIGVAQVHCGQSDRKFVSGNRHVKQERINSKEADEFIESILNDTTKVPDSVDWRNNDPTRVLRAGDQGKCKASWAFVTTGLLEGHFHPSVKFSEQSLIDCSGDCYGDEVWKEVEMALEFVASQREIAEAKSYPYEERKGKCKMGWPGISSREINISGPAYLPRGDEESLKKMVAKFGPVGVAIDANHNTFRNYSNTTWIHYNSECSNKLEDLNHAVLIVGYGRGRLGDYWIIKNSQGANWGVNGFGLMARNRKNNCGIATKPIIFYVRKDTLKVL